VTVKIETAPGRAAGVRYLLTSTLRRGLAAAEEALGKPEWDDAGGLMYRIREVDGFDDEIAETLTELHRLTFYESAPVPRFDVGHWWLAYRKAQAVGFAGVVPSTYAENAGYFCRVGVLQAHCGNALQLRLMRAIEARARREGWCCVISDTTDNLASANNFIRAGYLLYQPQHPWAWQHTLYWRKPLKRSASSGPPDMRQTSGTYQDRWNAKRSLR
jgi:GNAT superfamily N-acetyltransferase